jgi:crotonobetainyl-CoA:carnitine CoA-transferase CaiB-like acyl-CoA transferase
VLRAAHYRDRGALADVELVPGVRATIPTGCLEVNGARAGFRATAPRLGEHNHVLNSAALQRAAPPPQPPQTQTPRRPPFAGLRVLDLGVIVLGAEVGRLFADLGAEVIKVESRAFPDAGRTAAGTEMNPTA